MTLQLLTGSERSSPSKNGEEEDKSDDVKQSEDASRVSTTTEDKSEMKENEVSESYVEIAKEEMDRTAESNVNVQATAAVRPEQQQQEEGETAPAAPAAEISPGENSVDSENPDKSEPDLIAHDEPVGEANATSPGSLTPPLNPPPDPSPGPPPASEPLEDLGSCTR